jgi:glycosyltransferase involved in cell wall biosynthesis
MNMLMAPKVSICIPTYNRKAYLKETLESVFHQTYKDFEVVIVDDGSTDGTEEMIKENGYDVEYYCQENKGVAVAENKLIKLAKGEFISILGSDDLLMSDAIERLMGAMEQEEEDVIAYGPYLRIDEDGNVYGKCKRKLHSGYVTKYLFQDLFMHSCGSMFPKRVLENAGGFDTSLPVCADYDLHLRLSLKYRFIALHEPTFKRRRHSANLTSWSYANRLTQLKVLERFYYENGGHEAVPKKIAMFQLSKECYRAGCCAVKEGLNETAIRLLRQSFKRYPNFKSLFWWVIAAGKLCPASHRK